MVTVCSLSFSWWEKPDVLDVIRPELPDGRSGPVRALTDGGLLDQTGRSVQSRSGVHVVPYKRVHLSASRSDPNHKERFSSKPAPPCFLP